MFRAFERFMSLFETIFVSAGLMLLIITVFLAAVLRFFGVDMSVSTDLAQLTFAWVTFIGADLAMRQDKHMGVDMLINKFPYSIQNLVRLICYCMILGFMVLVVYYGINLCIINSARKYQTLYISYSWATASCPVGCGLMAVTAVKRIIECIVCMIKGDYSRYMKEAIA